MDENKMPENDGWKKNARLAIYAMAGFYLLTLFLIVGVGLIGFGLIAGYRNIKADHREDEK